MDARLPFYLRHSSKVELLAKLTKCQPVRCSGQIIYNINGIRYGMSNSVAYLLVCQCQNTLISALILILTNITYGENYLYGKP